MTHHVKIAPIHYEEIAKYSPKPKQYIDGETFKVFGREFEPLHGSSPHLYLACDKSI